MYTGTSYIVHLTVTETSIVRCVNLHKNCAADRSCHL